MIRKLLKRIAPAPLLAARNRLVIRYRRRRNRHLRPDEVFALVYANNEWGGAAGEFCSGGGSEGRFAGPYTRLLDAFFAQKANEWGRRVDVIDLGCGDFRVGAQLLSEHINYLGIDIVGALIERNRRDFRGAHVDFLQVDIIAEPLPAGDVCLVRQVLQHLSNDQIAAVLGKLRQYRHVFITEHQPDSVADCVPNLDKPHGGDVRLYDNSAVVLDQPPFAVSGLEEVLAIAHDDWGILRTFKIDYDTPTR